MECTRSVVRGASHALVSAVVQHEAGTPSRRHASSNDTVMPTCIACVRVLRWVQKGHEGGGVTRPGRWPALAGGRGTPAPC